MKWFKHLTNSRNDPDISDSFDEFGADGPYVFWITLEIFAQEFGGHSSVRLSKKYLARQTGYNIERLLEIYGFFGSEERRRPRIEIEIDGDYVIISIPKFTELADEYTKKRYRKTKEEAADVRTSSGQTPKKVHHEVEGEEEGEKEKDKSYVDQLKDEVESLSKQLHDEQEQSGTIPFKEIIDHLNQRSGRNFPVQSESSKRHIRARWKEGAKLDDFKKCIDNQCLKWLTDPKMREYLRPATLFNSEKFWGYVNSEAPSAGPRKVAL